MVEVRGDIWDFHNQEIHPRNWVVIPTNIGWKTNGENVKGAGLAKDAAARFPCIQKLYGEFCKENGKTAAILIDKSSHLVFFPVKTLNEENPHLSWKKDASLPLIERSLINLFNLRSVIEGKVFIPLVGCGAGRLQEKQVLPLMHKHLPEEKFVLVWR